MLKPYPAESDRLKALSVYDVDNGVRWLTIISFLLGYGFAGAHGVALAFMLVASIGFLLQYLKVNSAPGSLRLADFCARANFSFGTYFLCLAAGSLLLLLFKGGVMGSMRDMALWSLLFCLVSTVVKFSSRQWRWIAIGALFVSSIFIGTVAKDFFFEMPFFKHSAKMQGSVPVMFISYAAAMLGAITLALLGIAKVSKLWTARSEAAIVFSRQSFLKRCFCYIKRATRQMVGELPVYAFLAWYLGVVFFLSYPHGSVGDMVAEQFLHSAADANILPFDGWRVYSKGSLLLEPKEASRPASATLNSADPLADGVDNPPPPSIETYKAKVEGELVSDPYPLPPVVAEVQSESAFLREAFIAKVVIKCVVALGLLALPFSLIMRCAAFYAALMRRLIGSTGRLRFSEAALAAVRDTGDKLRLKYESRFWAHAARTFWWLLFWYAAVFSLVAFTSGGLGTAIRNWLDLSIVNSGLRHISTEYSLNMRYFMAAVLAMYACGPLAVTGCVFLPHRSGRKIVINEDGISAPDGPYISMWLRTFRLYVDIKSVKLKGKAASAVEYGKDRRRIKIHFRTGGSLSFRIMDMPPEDLRVLLERIDEHAEECELSNEVVQLRVQLSRESQAKSSNATSAGKGKFKSSIFVPFVGGEQIDSHNLRVVKVLANKPLSAVYLVRLASGRLAVLKQLVMPKDDEVAREHLRIFQRECEVMRALKHDGIAQVIDSFNKENSYFLLLEHFKGQDLKSVVDTYGARSIDDVARWALTLCDVLEYLHGKDIIHRDVTPENIVVGEHDGARLIDFGAAHQFIEGITGTLIGKQSYVAPEQLRGKASKRSDIYSLGVTMNFLLTAREPVALMQCEPSLGDGPAANTMRRLIMAMTDFDQEKRPENIQHVRQVLLSILNREESIAAVYLDVAPPTAVQEVDVIADSSRETGLETTDKKEAQMAERTIQLMAEAIPEPSLKVETRRKKKVKVKAKPQIEPGKE